MGDSQKERSPSAQSPKPTIERRSTDNGTPQQLHHQSPQYNEAFRNSFYNNGNNLSSPAEPLFTSALHGSQYQTYAQSTPDSHIESSIAFEGSVPTTPDGFKRRKKKKMKKKKSQRRTKSHIPINITEEGTQHNSGEELFNSELPVNKLERIYKPKSIYKHPEFSNINFRVISDSSSDDEEIKEPSRKEHYLRILDPNHNNFEMVSEGAQTDWSWLRDKQKLEKHEVDDGDLDQVLERLKFGLYGGFGPEKPEIVIKDDASEFSFSNDEEGHSVDEEIKTIEKRAEEDAKCVKKPISRQRNGRVKKSLVVKKSDSKRQRPVKSATKLRTENTQSGRRIKSATMPRKVSQPGDLDFNSDDSEVDISHRHHQQPEILKYHREKSSKKKDLPKMEVPEHDLDLPPADGIFNGPCQFCGKAIMTIPPLDEFNDDFSELFCCPEYKHFIKLHLENEDHNMNLETELIDISPSAPYGVKTNRKVARERIAERMREREIERQRIATQQANLFTFARQMKTIQYSLASPKCMEDGWTVKPPTPVPSPPNKDAEIFHVEVNSTLLQKSEVLNRKFYENGNKFLTIFPDGTGCCYYPNGNVAVMITSTEKEKFTYIVQSAENLDDLYGAGLLAVFEPNGNGLCYFEKKQRIRLFVNPHGGIELDKHGKRRKRWQWYFIKGHVHAPPFQPLCFALNKYLSVRVLDQDNIALIFASQKRSVRFNVGANLTVRGLEGHGNFAPDPSEAFLLQKKKETSAILQNIQNTLRFPKSSLSSRVSTRKSKGKKMISPRDILPPISSESSVVIN